MLLLLLVLLLMAASLASPTSLVDPGLQPSHYYCDTPGRDYINVPVDFYLYTRPNGSATYLPGAKCAFYAITQYPRAVYYVQLLNVSMPTANLTVSSGFDELLRIGPGVEPPAKDLTLASPRPTITVSFVAQPAGGGGSHVVGMGAILRVRLFSVCPPGWKAMGDFCFGNADNGRELSFSDAQDACKRMRANLLHLPPRLPGVDTITELYRSLPGELSSNNWIGLTDYTKEGQFFYYWLDGSPFKESNLIGCRSSLLGTNRNCKLEERCGFFINHVLYLFRFIVMDHCDSRRSYTCFMPAGGATEFYKVPVYAPFSSGAWVWAIVIGCLFLLGVSIGIVYAVLRLIHSRRSSTTV